MAIEKSDEELWAAVVAAQRQVARARAEFHQKAGSRRDVLAAALRSPGWDRRAALEFLPGLASDVPTLLEELVDCAMSAGWAPAVGCAIKGRHPDDVMPELRRIVRERLETADATDYRRVAELLRWLSDGHTLDELIARAKTSENEEIREVGEDFEERPAEN